MSYGRRAVRLLYDEYRDCQKCPRLCESRTQTVFGSGSVSADIMIIGEFPGTDEDKTGVPFTGASGKLLLQMLDMVWENEEEMAPAREMADNDEYFQQVRDIVERKIFFTNVVLCHPGERSPAPAEIKSCKERLQGTIYAVDPKIIIATGKTAASAVLGKNMAIMNRRGDIFDVRVTSPVTGRTVRYPMLAILHPSFLLRRGDQSLVSKKSGDTYKTMGDLRYAFSLLREYDRIQGASNAY